MLRKTILFATGLTLTSFALFSQNISVGPRLGYTLSTEVTQINRSLQVPGSDYDPDEDFRMLGSFHAGVDVRVPIEGRFSFLAGLLYVQKGYQTDFAPDQTSKIQLRYFNLPLLADCRLWKGLSVQAGIEPGILSAAWLKFDGGRTDLKPLNLYESFDLGLAAGLEWRLPEQFYVSGRYIWGVLPNSDVDVTDENGAELGRVRSRNRALEVAVGYRFNL